MSDLTAGSTVSGAMDGGGGCPAVIPVLLGF